MFLRTVNALGLAYPRLAMPAAQIGDLDPLALHFIELKEILQVHAQVPIDAESAEPSPSSLALGVGVSGAVGRGADEQPSELSRGVFHFTRDPVARPAFPALQLLGGLRGGGRVVVRAPVARRAQLQVEFLP